MAHEGPLNPSGTRPSRPENVVGERAYPVRGRGQRPRASASAGDRATWLEVRRMDETHKIEHGAVAAAAGAAEGLRYEQDLRRSIGIIGNIFITLSGVTPASSVFIIVPVALVAAGSGSFLAFVFAAIVGVFMAFCWAELSAAFPIAAGAYALVWHSFKGRSSWLAGPVSFITFALYVDFIAFIPAVIALGTGTYLAVIVNVNLKVIGAVVMLVAAGIAILNIRLNAVITGIFLAIVLAALAVVTILGIMPAKNWSSLVHLVAAELIPQTDTVAGSPSIAKLSPDAVPMKYFIEPTSNNTVYKIVSLAVVV